MHIAFLTNFLTHHQTPIADALSAREDVTYHFIACDEMTDVRKDLGWAEETAQDYLVQLNEDTAEQVENIIESCDVLIVGRAPYELYKNRVDAGKITLLYTDHLFKNWNERRDLVRSGRFMKEYVDPGMLDNTGLLCASAFIAHELQSQGAYIDRAWKWGYFPQTEEYNIDELIHEKPTKRLELLWVARVIDWKHPDHAILLAKKLKEAGFDFRLTMIGTGDQEHRIAGMIERYRLGEHVRFLGAKPADEIQGYMRASNALIFTSDHNEGWGAVVNEAMNAGCVVIGSDRAGCVPYLIEHNVNGLTYRSGSLKQLFERVSRVYHGQNLRDKLGRAAFETITSQWNSTLAADRLLGLCQSLADGDEWKCEKGPCSTA